MTRPHSCRRLNLDRNDRFFLFAILLCSLTFSLTLYLGDTGVTPGGPSFAMAETAKAVWESGSLTSRHAQNVFEAAQARSQSTHSDVWQDVFAMDVRGNLVGKHSIISSLIAAPLFGFFGTLGFWLCQQLFFVTLAFSLYRCASALAGGSLPWTSLAAICLLSPALVSSYRFSYDLHGVAFLLLGLFLSRSRPFLGGIAMGCAPFVRPSHILIVAPLLFAWFDPRDVKRSTRVVLGASVALTLFFLSNDYLWGSPFATAYSRLPIWSDGQLGLQAHPLGFDLKEFTSGWRAKLFGDEGLFSRHATIVTFPCAIWMALYSPHAHFFRTCLVAAVINILFIFSYSMWDSVVSPNRFLQPTIFLFLLAFTVLAGQIELRLRDRLAKNV